jgi:ribonuclease R
MARPRREAGGLPSREEILEFMAKSPTPVGKREIARAFKLGPRDRVALKGLLKDIERSGAAPRGGGRRPGAAGPLPEVAVLEVIGIDEDGELLAKPLVWPADTPAPRIYVEPQRGGAVGASDRIVARLFRVDESTYRARVIKTLGEGPDRVVGVFRALGEGGMIEPTDRRRKTEYRIAPADAGSAESGELVVAEVLPARRMGLPEARIVERLGDTSDPRSISLIAIHSQGIPTVFAPEAIALAEAAAPVALGSRTDLRAIPLVTIDGADARDFDDAVFAEPDRDPANPGGWHLLVAIADVSWYVRPGDALDEEARRRGNSVYFPDRVVPMLPEALSNELCSLKPAVERACLAVHMWIDAEGRKLRHHFVRGLMRSSARLTYEEVQRAIDGQADTATRTLLDPVIRPLYGAYAALDRERRRRGTLELDLPELRVVLGADGHVERIAPRARLDSHKLIEEFMIAANVAAAETLEAQRQPCMYRVHDAPDPARVESLRQFLLGLEEIGLVLARGQVVRPRHFNQLLHRAAETNYAAVVNELVLRSQAQAVYAPVNLGHFGLALHRYAHFTSPIRRYADLLVHRALVAGGKLGEGGLTPTDPAEFAATGEHISATERRAAAAERSAIDRYIVAFLADAVGATFAGRVVGATRAGLFVRLHETGADGLIPISTLPQDFYVVDEQRHRLVGRRWGRVYTLGDAVKVNLAEADTVTGSLRFALIEDDAGEVRRAPEPGDRGAKRPSPGKNQRSKRPPGGKHKPARRR